MKTYPIIFTAPMVRALLEGRKTQTRRLITSMWSNVKMHHEAGEEVLLYVRESWANDEPVQYRASAHPHYRPQKWSPSIHMPRQYSRLTLALADVRLQRLQDISEDDAMAEGFKAITKDGSLMKYGIPDRDGLPGTDDSGWPWAEWSPDPRQAYRHLWNSLHGPNAWDDNPEVIALTFRVHRCNVDEFIKQKTA